MISYDIRSRPPVVAINLRLPYHDHVRGPSRTNQRLAVLYEQPAYLLETSKCAKIEIFEWLGLPSIPGPRIVNHASQILEASSCVGDSGEVDQRSRK